MISHHLTSLISYKNFSINRTFTTNFVRFMVLQHLFEGYYNRFYVRPVKSRKCTNVLNASLSLHTESEEIFGTCGFKQFGIFAKDGESRKMKVSVFVGKIFWVYDQVGPTTRFGFIFIVPLSIYQNLPNLPSWARLMGRANSGF